MIRQLHVERMSNIRTHIHQSLRQQKHRVILTLVLKLSHQLTQARENAKVVLVDIIALIVLQPLEVDQVATAIAQHQLAVCLMELLIDTHTSVSKFYSFASEQ